MFKTLQARPQQYMNWELSDVQAGFRKGRRTRDQIANICWIIGKAREFQKKLLLLSWVRQSLWLCGSQQTGKFLKRWKYQTTLPVSWDTCMCIKKQQLEHGIMSWFKIGKGVCQGCILSPCLFNLYAKYIMQHAGLDDSQAGIKTARRNISNLRYADDTTLMAERAKRNWRASWWGWKRW